MRAQAKIICATKIEHLENEVKNLKKGDKMEKKNNKDKISFRATSDEDDVEKVDYQTAKKIAGNYTLGNIADVAQANFNLFIKELEEKAKSKYEVEYTTLDSDEPKIKYARKVIDLLFLIKVWNEEAIKWNLIANGDVSKIPPNFKDIYIKVYDSEIEYIVFQDECTLKSKGLKSTWIRED